MHSFSGDKRAVRELKRLLQPVCIIAALAVFCVINTILRVLIIDDTSSYTRIMMHQLYEQENQIEVLVIGSSHAYRSFVPKIMDDELGVHTFNAGSSSQGLDGSYAVLKETCRHHKPQSVYLELYYGIAESEEYEDRTQMTATYILSDYMRPSLNKMQFLLQASDTDYYIDSFIPARRNWRALFDPEYIKELAKKKSAPEYKDYMWVKTSPQDEEYYVDRGFVANDAVAKTDIQETAELTQINKANTITTENDWYKSLIDIIDYCRDNNIQLSFVIAPQPAWSIDALGHTYREYSDLVRSIARDYGIEFMDFNYCKEALFDKSNSSYFKDADHLNTKGAEMFTKAFCRCITEPELVNTMFE